MAISVWSRQKRSLIFLFVLLAAMMLPLLQIARPFRTAFIISSILAISLHPVKERLRRRLHRAGLATFLTTFAAVVILGGLLTIASISITGEMEVIYDSFSHDSLEEGGWPALAALVNDQITTRLAEHLPIDEQAVRAWLMNGIRTSVGYLLSHLGLAVSGVAAFLFNGVLVTVFLYFLLRYGHIFIRKLAAMTPLDPPVAANIIKTIRNSVMANVNGMLAVMLGQATLLIVAFTFTGVRSPVLWGLVGGFTSIIPVVGSMLIWAPVAIAFFFMGSYGKALILIGWGILVLGTSDNVLRSLVVGKQGKQHPVLVALAAIGGVYAFGVLGILLGPLAIALAIALVKEIQQLLSGKAESRRAPIAADDDDIPAGRKRYHGTLLGRLLFRRRHGL